MIKKTPQDTPLVTIWNYSTKEKYEMERILQKKTRGTKSRVFCEIEKLRHFRNNLGIKSPFDKRSNSLQTIPKSDIKGRMLRFRFDRKVCRERLPKFKFGSLGKRWERSKRVRRSQTFLTFHPIYICRYLADRQLFFLAVKTFIY